MRAAVAAILLALTIGGSAAATPTPTGLAEQQRRLIAAKRAAAAAATRADHLARAARTERDRAARAKVEEQALAARVAAAVADLDAARARVALVGRLQARQRAVLGATQAPVARLLAALQSLGRRPAAAAIAQPGSVDDMVHLRAVLGAALPVVEARTAGVRAALAQSRTLRAQADLAAAALRSSRIRLEGDRVALAKLEASHRARAGALGRDAIGESDRALALGERARDLVDGMAEQGAATATAGDLAQLAGPVPRPLAPGVVPPARVRGVYRLPVAGRLMTGLDEISDAGVRSRGLTFAVAPGAVVVAPADGVVRYARRFREYGTIVIIDHGQGWNTLVTGLADVGVRPGASVMAGAPIGHAGRGEDPRVTVELRRRGRPADIAALVG